MHPARLRDRLIDLTPGRLRRWADEQLSRVPVQRARWWLVERLGDSSLPTSVAYEDKRGLWWEFEPETGMLHETPWLYTEYHHGSEFEEFRFTRLAPVGAKLWIERGIGRRDSVGLVGSRRTDDRALDPAQLLGA